MLALGLPPLTGFVVVRPGDWPDRVVRAVQVAASAWYAVVASGLLVALAAVRPPPPGWPVYPPLLAAGAVPCAIVLYRAARGRYRPRDSELPGERGV